MVRRFAEARTRRVILTARDVAGNESFAVRAYRPRAASAVRGLSAPSVASRRGNAMNVVGRVVRPTRLRALLRPVRTSARPQATRSGLAASFVHERVGAPVARTVAAVGGASAFRLRVRVRGLRPGVYRLEVSVVEPGERAGPLTISRRVQIR